MVLFPERPVAVLCSGGDSPGMNAFVRALARLGANQHNTAVIGVRDGYRGLVRTAGKVRKNATALKHLKGRIGRHRGRFGLIRSGQDLILLDHASVSGIVGMGGTMLGSARCLEFHQKECRAAVIDLLKGLGVAALVVLGGDGSLAGAECLANESDLRIVGVPATIDNDLMFTEMALGVDTAVSTLVWAIDHFKDTARSHRRIMVLETMGRDSGELARLAAIAAGAEMVITPEEGTLTEARVMDLAKKIETGMAHGRGHAIILISEGVNFDIDPPPPAKKRNRAYVLADAFQAYFQGSDSHLKDLEVRPSVLGHMQRGGHPTPQDTILAARFAARAWDAIVAPKKTNGITALRQGRVELVPFGSEPLPEREEMGREFARLHENISSW